MTLGQIDKLIHENQVKSINAYMRRQQLESQRQQIMITIQLVDQELLMLDGEAKALASVREQDGE